MATAKIPHALLLAETYEEAKEPVVIFSDHTSITNAFAKKEGWGIIDGSIAHAKRTKVVSQFQEGKLRGIAATIGAGGVGITLTRSHHAVFTDLRWTPEDNSQAEDRLCRIGQDRGVIITRLVANHKLDSHITKVLHDKQILIGATIEGEEQADGN